MRRPAGARGAGCLAVVAGLALASCAPPPRPGSAVAELAARYEAGRVARERMLRSLSAELVLRVDGRATGRLPALPATVLIASPDRIRLQVDALIGVGLDVLVDADSVRAWAPGQRMAFAAPRESLGIGDPVALAGRVVGAVWEIPPEAWARASSDSASWRLAWREHEDSLAVSVDVDGRPRDVWLGRGGRGLRVTYTDWARVGGEAFPERWELADDSGWARVRIRLDEARVAQGPGVQWFRPRRYSSAPFGWSDLRILVQRGGLP